MADAATLFYPPQRGWQTTDLSIPQLSVPVSAQVATANFWSGLTAVESPGGPGALPKPQNKGSIKAAKVVNHGICSMAVPFRKPPP